MLERAVSAAKGANDPGELIQIKLRWICSACLSGNLDAAIASWGHAFRLYEKSAILFSTARCLTYLAVAYRKAGQESPSAELRETRVINCCTFGNSAVCAWRMRLLAWVVWKNATFSRSANAGDSSARTMALHA